MSKIINILSIDLDGFWEGSDTIYVDKSKKLITDSLIVLKQLIKKKCTNKKYGLDHNEIVKIIDNSNQSKFNIYNFDAHHDLYSLNPEVWLNPLNIRGKRIDIGNMFFQLIRENKIEEYTWLVNNHSNIDILIKDVKRNIGDGYMSKIKISKINDFKQDLVFDFLFISISPEWIPSTNLEWILSTLKLFINISDKESINLTNKIVKRWGLGDNNILINQDRFTFDYNYVQTK